MKVLVAYESRTGRAQRDAGSTAPFGWDAGRRINLLVSETDSTAAPDDGALIIDSWVGGSMISRARAAARACERG